MEMGLLNRHQEINVDQPVELIWRRSAVGFDQLDAAEEADGLASRLGR